MSIHIGAEKGQVAPIVLMPGDPLRAKFFAETLLEDAVCFNEVRGMLGFTGTYRGQQISTMGSGMGIPSFSIYMTELVQEYDVKTVIRVGTCGAFQPDLQLGDVVLAVSASTDSNVNRLRFGGRDFAPHASFDLLLRAYEVAQARGVKVRAGGVFSGDTFYDDDPDAWKLWAGYGVLAVDMETSALYTLAAKHGISALAILTVSDNLATHALASSEERERGYGRMAEIALEAVTA